MNREFLINIAFLLFVNLLIKPFYIFGIERVVQNRVADGEYGLYFNLFSFAVIFSILTDLGVQYYNNRNVAQHRHLLAKYFPGLLILKFGLGVAYLVVVVVAGWLWGFEAGVWPLLLLIGLNQILASLVLFLRSNISGLGMFRTDSFMSVLDRLLLILICGALLWQMPTFKIEWFVMAQTVSLALTAIIALLSFRTRLHAFRVRIQPARLLFFLKKSYPYALVVFLMYAYTRLDGVLLEKLLPNGRLAADVYAAAYRLLDAANAIGVLFGGLLLPMFARMLKEKTPIEPLLTLALKLIWTASVALSISVFFFQREIMEALYHDGDAYAGQVLGMLILAFVGISCTYIYGPLLTANANLRSMNKVFIAGIFLNLALNLWLIPRYEALGAAIATLATQTFVAFGKGRLAHQLLKLQVDYRFFLQLLAYAILCSAVGYFLHHAPWGHWIARFLISLGLCSLLAAAMRFVEWKTFATLLSPDKRLM